MTNIHSLNTDTYVFDTPTVSRTVTFDKLYEKDIKAIIYNGHTLPVFVTEGSSATFPTSATVSARGKVVPPGVSVLFSIADNATQLSAIGESGSGTGKVFVSVGVGE